LCESREENKKTGTLNSDYPGYVEVYSPYSEDQKVAHVGTPGDTVEILGSWSDKGMRWLEVDISGTKGWIGAGEVMMDQGTIAEGEAEHFPWLKEIQATNDLKEIQAIVETDRFKKIGGGSFRRVYEPVGDPDHVIKVIHDPDDYKRRMNEDDFNTAKRYPFIFPKAYAHADDFSWIVMERTPPLLRPEDMQKVLDQSFPVEQEALLRELALQAPSGPEPESLLGPGPSSWWAQWNPADPFHIMKMIMDSFRHDRKIAPEKVSIDPNDADREALDLQKIIAPVSGRAYQELSKVMHEFAIDKYEIGRGNIGHDKDYNFKIVDSSVFDPDWDPEVP